MATIFSKIIAGEIPSYKCAENDKFYAFLDINPVNKGHVLVVPKTENDYIFNLSDDDYQSLTMFARRVAKAIDKALSALRADTPSQADSKAAMGALLKTFDTLEGKA